MFVPAAGKRTAAELIAFANANPTGHCDPRCRLTRAPSGRDAAMSRGRNLQPCRLSWLHADHRRRHRRRPCRCRFLFICVREGAGRHREAPSGRRHRRASSAGGFPAGADLRGTGLPRDEGGHLVAPGRVHRHTCAGDRQAPDRIDPYRRIAGGREKYAALNIAPLAGGRRISDPSSRPTLRHG